MLTVKEIEAIKPGHKVADHHGLTLAVTKADPPAKIWRHRYTFKGKPNEMTLGEYPFMKPEQARDAHTENRKMLRAGIDPMAARKAKKEEEKQKVVAKAALADNTFKKMARKWWEKHEPSRDTNSWMDTWDRLERYVFPKFGQRLITDIQLGEVRDCVLEIEAAGHRPLADKIKNNIIAIFDHVVVFELAPLKVNPLLSLRTTTILSPHIAVNHPRVSEAELPALLYMIDNYPKNVIVRMALKLLPHLVIRPGPLLSAPWDEFDLDDAQWLIPKDRMKHHGHKRDGTPIMAPHIVPLSRQTVQMLRHLHTLTGHGKLVFPGEQDHTKGLSDGTLSAVLNRNGYKGRQSPNGFRGIASTILHGYKGKPGCDFTGDHIETQLAHLIGTEVQRAYNWQDYLPERTVMMQWYSDFLDSRLAEASKP